MSLAESDTDAVADADVLTIRARILRRRDTLRLCQRFLTPFSLLPGIDFEMRVHLLPSFFCSRNKMVSSSFVHGVFFKVGSRILTNLSRTCSPILPGSRSAISAHLRPSSLHLIMRASSPGFHLPLTMDG